MKRNIYNCCPRALKLVFRLTPYCFVLLGGFGCAWHNITAEEELRLREDAKKHEQPWYPILEPGSVFYTPH
jgi:hypothetical protein